MMSGTRILTSWSGERSKPARILSSLNHFYSYTVPCVYWNLKKCPDLQIWTLLFYWKMFILMSHDNYPVWVSSFEMLLNLLHFIRWMPCHLYFTERFFVKEVLSIIVALKSKIWFRIIAIQDWLEGADWGINTFCVLHLTRGGHARFTFDHRRARTFYIWP